MRNPIAIGAATLLIALSFGVAACGSSEDSSDGALTNSELIAQANEICVKYTDEVSTAAEEAFGDQQPPNAELAVFITDEVVPLYEDQIAELRALEPSEDDSAAYTEMLDTLETELQAVAEDPEAAAASDNPFPDATAKADEFGLEDCGSR
ncbi:MAG: hypothetical protein QG596_915 [Actinomycetota bacterium]|jgi:hypothetical protein|nr:hypothetical protein [Actinomycetota bacterium]